MWGSQFWPAVWSRPGRDVKDLSGAAAAFRNKLVREMETYIYNGGSQCDQSDGSEFNIISVIMIIFSLLQGGKGHRKQCR